MLTLLTTGIVLSAVFLALFILKSPKKSHDQILMIWFLCYILQMGFLLARVYFREDQTIRVMADSFSLVHGPLLYIYTLSIFKGQMPGSAWLHIAPIIVIMVFGRFFDDLLPFHYSTLLVPLKILSYSVYPVLVILIVKNGIKSLKMERADHFIPNVIWIQGVSIILLISLGVGLLILLISTSFNLDNYQFFDRLRFVITIFLLGFYGLKLGVIFTPDDHQDSSRIHDDAIYRNSPLESVDRKRLVNRLIQFFENEDSFLKSDFSLGALSVRLETPKHHLSEIISTELKTTFYELVNHHRTLHAAKRIADKSTQHLTLEAIGYECGYNSKSAFFGHFKKNLGRTPRQYLLEISSS